MSSNDTVIFMDDYRTPRDRLGGPRQTNSTHRSLKFVLAPFRLLKSEAEQLIMKESAGISGSAMAKVRLLLSKKKFTDSEADNVFH